MSNLPIATNERLAALKARAALTQEVKLWKPLAGEMIAGMIKGSGTFNHSLYGEQRTMLLEDESGTITSVILTKYLMTGLRQAGAVMGSLVVVTFHGKEISKSGHAFNRYSLEVDNGV